MQTKHGPEMLHTLLSAKDAQLSCLSFSDEPSVCMNLFALLNQAFGLWLVWHSTVSFTGLEKRNVVRKPLEFQLRS